MINRRAFTLIELLIAAAIFSIIVLSLYSAFHSGFLSYRRIDSSVTLYQSARILLDRMQKDLENSFSYSSDDSKFIGQASSLEFFSIIDSFEDAKSLSSICKLAYFSEDRTLKRSCSRGLDILDENKELEPEGLAYDVKEISFQYAYPTNNPEDPFQWQDTWPSRENPEQKTDLPTAVRIKLSLIEKQGLEKEVGTVEFERIVPLKLSKTNPPLTYFSARGR